MSRALAAGESLKATRAAEKENRSVTDDFGAVLASLRKNLRQAGEAETRSGRQRERTSSPETQLAPNGSVKVLLTSFMLSSRPAAAVAAAAAVP